MAQGTEAQEKNLGTRNELDTRDGVMHRAIVAGHRVDIGSC